MPIQHTTSGLLNASATIDDDRTWTIVEGKALTITGGTLDLSGTTLEGVAPDYLEVVDATARLALTDKTNGTHVREIGRSQTVTLTALGSTYTPAVAESIQVVCQANVGTSTSFYWSSTSDSYSIWFNVDGTGVDPMLGASVTLEVTLPASPTAAQTATAIKAAVDGIAGSPFGTAIISGAGSDTVTWTNAVTGQTAVNSGDIDAGFAITPIAVGSDALHSLFGTTTLYGSSNVAITVGVSQSANGDIPVALSVITHSLTPTEVAALMAAAIDTHADFTATSSGATVTVVNADAGAVTAASGSFSPTVTVSGVWPGSTYELTDEMQIASEDGWAMLGGNGDASAPRVMRMHSDRIMGSVIEMDAGGTGNGSIGRIQFCRSTDPANTGWRGLIFSVNGLATDEGTRPKDDPARGWHEFHLESNYFGKGEARLMLSGQSIFTITSPESDPDNVDWVNYAPQYSIVPPGNTLTLQGLPVPTHGLEDGRASGASLRLYSTYAILTKFDWIALNGTLKLRDQAAEADRITVTQAGKVKLGVLLNLPVYTNSSPEDGDVWRADNTDTGLKVRINGVTKTITVT